MNGGVLAMIICALTFVFCVVVLGPEDYPGVP